MLSYQLIGAVGEQRVASGERVNLNPSWKRAAQYAVIIMYLSRIAED